ncbi:hypothetical protein BofuT4_uP003190.1 [Botrytis cinerea T4]|uniref:Uncharacterized protein n=1 Tax=Botryotinia fuckeliana (strain T4) TaxID=999810 RepID=G2Y3C0_BOTF4|nr:hypothetical protein BofuT4_uP003190.1 [Botrytis cinerea T4]
MASLNPSWRTVEYQQPVDERSVVLLMPRQLLLLVLLVFNVSSRPKKSIRPRNQNMIFLPSSFQLYVSACVNFPLSKINPSRTSERADLESVFVT